ncbi:MAG TPA: site-2 protease family protein [Verrucomicrobiae bacterium]|nr:site-2 protease family protein [Verrucomicrobiae bacterium]
MTLDVIEGLKWYVVFVFSTTAHEAAHAWTSLKLGDDTAYRGGQVTLDPTPHIRREPVGMVAVPLISYVLGGWMIGWASAPYDPHWAMRHPKHAATMSLAGPAANLLILLTAALLIHVGIAFHYFDTPSSINFSHVVDAGSPLGDVLASLLSIFFSLNLLLCTFNLLPLPPLDGSGALMFFTTPEKAEKVMETMQQPAFQMIGLIIAWRVFSEIFPAIQLFAVNLLYPGVGYH